MAAPMSKFFSFSHNCFQVKYIIWNVRRLFYYILLTSFIYAASISAHSNDENGANDEFEGESKSSFLVTISFICLFMTHSQSH